LKQPKLAKFEAMHSKGKPVTGPITTEKAKYFMMK